MKDFINQIIKKHLSPTIQLNTISSVSGGCINTAYKVETDQGSFFLKWNKEELDNMFQSEDRGLSILKERSPIKIPETLGQGIVDHKSYLLTEWIETGHPSSKFWENFSINLASQHKKTTSEFGLDHDNYIGRLHQSNTQHSNWHEFFIDERLAPQLDLASSNNLVSKRTQEQFEVLFTKLKDLIPNEQPSLLHGDLWSGNFKVCESGEVAIFDPSVHYGHRETELAFTQLFGGFSTQFYHSYHEEYPLEPSFDNRIDIHNLYPLLVHVNLFGSSYLSGIVDTLNRFT